MYKSYYKTCNCVIELNTPIKSSLVLNEQFNKFKVDIDNTNDIDIKITHNLFKLKFNFFKKYKTRFQNSTWIIKESNTDILYFYKPYNIKAVVNKELTDWRIYLPKNIISIYNKKLINNLCVFYSDQVMLYPYVIKNNGLILHGNSLIKNNKAITLLGSSGTGKSTLSKKLEQRGWSLLCDDRTILLGNKAFGHWCHGSYEKTSNLTAYINKFYFLYQSTNITIIETPNKVEELYKNIVSYFNVDLEYVKKIYKLQDIKYSNLYFDLSYNVINDIENDLIN